MDVAFTTIELNRRMLIPFGGDNALTDVIDVKIEGDSEVEVRRTAMEASRRKLEIDLEERIERYDVIVEKIKETPEIDEKTAAESTSESAAASTAGNGEGKTWTTFFDIENRTFASTGRNRFFILEPGFELVAPGVDIVDQFGRQGPDPCIGHKNTRCHHQP